MNGAAPSTPLTPAQLMDQMPKDFETTGLAGVPSQMQEYLVAMRRIMQETNRQLTETAAENKRLQDLEAKRKAIEEAEAKKYAASREPIAKEVLAAWEKVVAEEGVAPLSDGWKQLQIQKLTDNNPLSVEEQAATVACMRKISRMEKESSELKARNLELELAAQEQHKMVSVEESQRSERRDLKAGRRSGGGGGPSVMEPDQTLEDNGPNRQPAWWQQMASRSAPLSRPSKFGEEFMTAPLSGRGVNAGRSAQPARQQQQPHQVPARQQAPPQQHSSRTLTGGRTACGNEQQQQQQQPYFQRTNLPTLGPGNRMDIAQPDLYAFMNDVRQRAPLSGGFAYHMAGQPMSAPRDLKWGEN